MNSSQSYNAVAKFLKLIFQFDEITKYFNRIECPPEFEKVPRELVIEKTRRPDIIKSNIIIRGRTQNGKYLFFTGLIPTKYQNWYHGNDYEITNGLKKNSFCLFHFNPNNTGFEMYYFPGFKLYPRSRGKFIANFIRTLQK